MRIDLWSMPEILSGLNVKGHNGHVFEGGEASGKVYVLECSCGEQVEVDAAKIEALFLE